MKMQERGLWNSRNITVNVTLVTPVYKEASMANFGFVNRFSDSWKRFNPKELNSES